MDIRERLENKEAEIDCPEEKDTEIREKESK